MSRAVIKLIDLHQGRNYLLQHWKWEDLYEHQQNLLCLNVTLNWHYRRKSKSKTFRLRYSLSVHLAWHNLWVVECFSHSTLSVRSRKDGSVWKACPISWVRKAFFPCPRHTCNSSNSCHELGEEEKSVWPSILTDCRAQVFFAFLSVLQNPPIKARHSLVFCGWNRKKKAKRNSYVNRQCGEAAELTGIALSFELIPCKSGQEMHWNCSNQKSLLFCDP